MIADKKIRSSIIDYCSFIGQNSLLVQGSGGNISWKDDKTLWIKASGTWLAHAKEKDIFVPVELTSLYNAIANEDFSVIPTVLNKSILRPSIETWLHISMPHPIVLHLHQIDILAHLIRVTWLEDVKKLIGNKVTWTSVPYKKPGTKLAKAVSQALKKNPSANVIFLQNHGVVIGGNDIIEVNTTLNILTNALQISPIEYGSHKTPVIDIGFGYMPIADSDLHILAKNSTLFSHLKSKWSLYPDHVVFMGLNALTFANFALMQNFLKTVDNPPELIFLQDEGVFVQPSFSFHKQVQLRCYYDVLVRQQPDQLINTLLPTEVSELLNWEAEKYRILASKK